MLRMCLLFVVVFTFSAVTAVAAGLKVGMSPDYPPLAFKQEGKVVGIEADSAKILGKLIGKDITLVEIPFVDLLNALKAGEIDVIMSGMSVTPERSEQVTFIEPYMEVGQMAITHISKAGQFAQPWSIYGEGVRIGVEPATTGAEYAKSELEEAQIKFYVDPEAAFAGLRNDEIDLYIHDAPTSWQLAAGSENADLFSYYKLLTKEPLAWAVRKDDPLAAELNMALGKMKANGTLRHIVDRWIRITVEVR